MKGKRPRQPGILATSPFSISAVFKTVSHFNLPVKHDNTSHTVLTLNLCETCNPTHLFLNLNSMKVVVTTHQTFHLIFGKGIAEKN